MSDLSERLASLTPEKRALLERLLQKKGQEYNTFPLSYSQQRLWLLDQLQPGNTSYNMPAAFHLQGTLNVPALERSLNTILERHEALRTSFAVVGGQPVQVIARPAPLTLVPIDLTALPTAERDAAAHHLIDAESSHVFDLARGPLYKITFIRLAATDHYLIVNLHHIVSDGWSIGILTRELAALYRAYAAELPSPLPPLTIQYADYAVWQRDQSQDGEQVRQIAYWREHLRDAPAILEMPTDFPRPAVQAFRGSFVTAMLPQPMKERLQGISRQENATLFMTMLTIFDILLFRLTNQPDIVVGTPIANRNRADTEGLIGFFVNTLALRLGLTSERTFREQLALTREAALGAFAHQDVSFDRLLEELHPTRDLSYAPLFQVLFNMVNLPEFENQWDTVRVDMAWPQELGSKFDLTLFVEEHANGLLLNLVYNADLFTAERMQEMLAQYAFLAEQLVRDPAMPLGSLSLVTPTARLVLPDPRAELSDHWEGAVHTLFAQQAALHPAKVAVIDDQDTWTYGELDARSNQLAQALQARGIQPGAVVAIYAHRNASLVWAILGILKAGAAYLMLDPAYPAARLGDYVRAAQPRGWIAIADSGPMPPELADYFTADSAKCQLVLPRLNTARSQALFAEYPESALDVVVGPDQLASITFTSGSTGRPKGILQRHGPLTHFLPWQQATFGLGSDDRYSMLSGLSHDPLQRDIFTPLCLGATICVPRSEDIGMPGWLAGWLRAQQITVTNLTPAMLQLVAQGTSDAVHALPDLRRAFTVGDALKRHDVARLWDMAPNVTCINMYGSTETQRAVSFYVIPRTTPDAEHPPLKEVIPLGQGLHDVQLLIMSPTQQPCGIGECGEILVRSPHLAQGYLGEEALTRERFILNPVTMQPGDRCYRSGDLGRYLPDGTVEYLARNDQQVKIRGFRIELGEIEAGLRGHPAVREVAVIAREDVPNVMRLVAYVVPTTVPPAPDLDRELWRYLQGSLPAYMLPAAWVFLDALPLTPNGKLDRPALPMPESGGATPDAYVAPRTPNEELLAEVWQRVLGIDRVGVYDNFFELGGHSLLATQMISRYNEAAQGTFITLRMLFEAPTIAGLMALLTSQMERDTVPVRPALIPLDRHARNGESPH